jgi:hypothetical protein
MRKRTIARTTTVIAGLVTPALLLASGTASAEPRPGQNPGMQRMHELMLNGNPGMARMHQLMVDGNPGLTRMHHPMTTGDMHRPSR